MYGEMLGRAPGWAGTGNKGRVKAKVATHVRACARWWKCARARARKAARCKRGGCNAAAGVQVSQMNNKATPNE